MSRRKGALASLAALAVLAVLGAWMWYREDGKRYPDCPWTGTKFEWDYRYRVHDGMTLEEVEAVLGEGKYRPNGMREYRGTWGDGNWREIVVEGDTEFYVCSRGPMKIWVGFRDGKVVHKWFHVARS